MSPNMDRNGDCLNIVGKYMVSDMLFNLANWFGYQKKLVTVAKTRAIKARQAFDIDSLYKKVHPYLCETYMLPSQQIKAQVEWSKETGHSSYLEYKLGGWIDQPPVYVINLPDLI